MRAVPPVGGSGESIDSLPDGVLEHILGFLPSPEAVRSSVLARRWRHLWKSATGVRIGRRNELMSVELVRSLVNHLMLLRGDSPLDICELTFGDFGEQDDVAHVNLWFRRVVMCKARVLRLLLLGGDYLDDLYSWLELHNLPLVSEHLTRLLLGGVRVHNKLLDFSRCLALEHLEIECCNLSMVTEISSDSLKHLHIDDVLLCRDSRTRIYAPNLVSLFLDLLCRNCRLLEGLSDAKHLALISEPKKFIFKRDLRFCPMFQKLKTLLLNDYWCVPDDFDALSCMLEHSPVLEELTLLLGSKMNLRVSSTKRSAAISEHLKKVELKCNVVDDRVLKILKFLCTLFNINSINISKN
ncbi:hypothetical protein BS78_05G105800 [Paspalum vaginatum]|nr:hypothetical protein BS78_05G105800 [Paspalum vaginatum]